MPNKQPKRYPLVGDRLHHFRFGDGTVIAATPERVRVQFDDGRLVREFALFIPKVDAPKVLPDGRRFFRFGARETNSSDSAHSIRLVHDADGSVSGVSVSGILVEVVKEDDLLIVRCTRADVEDISTEDFPDVRLEMDDYAAWTDGRVMFFLVWCEPGEEEKTLWGEQVLFDAICEQIPHFPHLILVERYPLSLMLVATTPRIGTIGEALHEINASIDELIEAASDALVRQKAERGS